MKILFFFGFFYFLLACHAPKRNTLGEQYKLVEMIGCIDFQMGFDKDTIDVSINSTKLFQNMIISTDNSCDYAFLRLFLNVVDGENPSYYCIVEDARKVINENKRPFRWIIPIENVSSNRFLLTISINGYITSREISLDIGNYLGISKANIFNIGTYLVEYNSKPFVYF